MFETCLKHVSNGFKTRLNVFQTKTPKKRFTISPLFIWRVTYSIIDNTPSSQRWNRDGLTSRLMFPFSLLYYRSYKSHTWLVLFKNHFSWPRTVRSSSQNFSIQISGWACLTSRRWKHSSSSHDTLPWLEHSWPTPSVPWWWQYGQATHNSYCSPLRYGSSCDKVCKVSSTNSLTWVASSSDFSTETWWPCIFCLRTILIKLLLQMTIKSWICFPITNHAPFWYSLGCCKGHVLQHQRMNRDTSCENRPCGTKPCTKWIYKGQGSVWDGDI